MGKIQIEISDEFEDSIDFLKQVVGNKSGEPVKDNGELVEIMLAGFVSMIQEEMADQSHHHHHGEDGCGCGHDHH